MPLTGRFTFRRTFTGKIVLQVEEERRSSWPFSGKVTTRRRWRDATMMDLAMPEMRALIDLRHKPQFMPHRFQDPALAPIADEAPAVLPGAVARADGVAHTTH